MKSLIVFTAFLALASANSVLSNENAEQEARLLYSTNNGNYYLGLNATYLWAAAGVAAVVAAAIIIYYAAIERSGQAGVLPNYNRYGTDYEQYYQQGQYQQSRQRRSFDSDVASKMAQLEQAFKKYQVEEAECEMYIACEASQVHRIEENGPLARIVYDILSTFNRAKDGHKWDDRMNGLVQAFEFGTGAHQAGQADPCQPLRNKCFELHAKKAY